jgi:uncharacterized membrane-anchored protein YhcB (DUF1043 family)
MQISLKEWIWRLGCAVAGWMVAVLLSEQIKISQDALVEAAATIVAGGIIAYVITRRMANFVFIRDYLARAIVLVETTIEELERAVVETASSSDQLFPTYDKGIKSVYKSLESQINILLYKLRNQKWFTDGASVTAMDIKQKLDDLERVLEEQNEGESVPSRVHRFRECTKVLKETLAGVMAKLSTMQT